VLGALGVLLALAYVVACLCCAAPRIRYALLGTSAVLLVVIPTLGLVALGTATGRPFGQDGGVVQLPLALDKILAGESPHGADYSDSMLGKQARVSGFWDAYPGGNPILRHHAYLPGTHLAMLPGYLVCRAAGIPFDTRLVTLIAYALAAWLATRLAPARWGPLAAAVLLVNPLVYWHQVFGANDLLVAALLLLAFLLTERDRRVWAAAVLGLACATKQLAWPFAPFLLVRLSGARSFADLVAPATLRRLTAPVAASAVVFVAVVLPVAALDFRRFWGDIVVYNVGLPGADNYPLGGTPGFGFANFLIVAGRVASLQDYVPFGRFYVVLVPVGLLLARHVLREGSTAAVLTAGSAALLASLYLSRVVHPNYLVLAAVMLPLGALLGARVSLDGIVVPLLLLAGAAEVAQHEVLRTLWADGVLVDLPTHAKGWLGVLVPRGPQLTPDPWGFLWSACAAGLAIAWLVAAILGAGRSHRAGSFVLAVGLLVIVPTALVARVGAMTGLGRGQDAWLGSLTPPARALDEAWSGSFRRDPPRALPREGEALQSAGAGAIRAALQGLGARDPRVLTSLALILASVLIALAVPSHAVPLALGASLLGPPILIGVPFGSGDALLLALVLLRLALGTAARPVAAAAVLGVALALFPRLLPAVPFLGLAVRPLVARGERTAAVTLSVWGVFALASAFLGPTLLWSGAVRPGLGLTNLLLYRADDAPQGWLPLLAFLALCAGSLVLARRTKMRGPQALAAAAVALLASLWVLPGASAHDLATPLALLVLAALREGTAAEDGAARA
jgi:hypothetical protein